MLINYFKIAWRNLAKHKSFTAINVLGLALGMACSLLIMLWVQDERSVDSFHKNGDQLYQVYERQYYDGKVDAGYTTQGLLADELKKVIPEIQYASGFEYVSAPGTLTTLQAGEKVNKMQGFFAGNDFFSMFSYPLLYGSTTDALVAPEAIAVSRKMAESFFDRPENAIGKTIRFEDKEDLMITAVFENLPANSSQQFDFLRSWPAFVQQNNWVNNWSNTSPSTFVQLRKDAVPGKVQANIKDFIYRYTERSKSSVTELALQPYTERYLYSNFKNGVVDGGRIQYVQLFTWVAIFILLIACINFMNLATARSATRAKEVGVRKVIGALRSSLIGQFLSEAMLITFISAILAVVLVLLLLPAFNMITSRQLTLPVSQPLFWGSFVGLLLLTGFTAGIYPAFFLSALKPIKVLKGKLSFGKSAAFFRKGLVVFQFTLSIILIVGMVVIYRQVNFIQSKNIGYNRENLVYVPIEGNLVKNYSVFKDELLRNPAFVSISKMRNSPTIIEHHAGGIEWPGKDPNLSVSFADGVVGYDFVKTMQLQMAQGRDFSKEFISDSTAFLINETAAAKMGLDDAVGTSIKWGKRNGKIIGVLKDFHFSSMHQAIDPLIIRLDENWSWGTILVRTKAGETKQAISSLQAICKDLNPKFPFTYQFSDLEFDRLYKSELVVSKLADGFALLAIFISCMGLFGLATFITAQRKKEIGVRKVLGAGVAGITALLSIDFIKLVLVAVIIGLPVSAWMMNKWLEDFAYKSAISWWIFIGAAAIAICVALVTVSFQAIKAAVANPVKSLRTE
ncbi:MAG: ABC transporter permease [Ferruginibacter sp.]